MSIIQANMEDGRITMNNLFLKLKGQEIISLMDPNTDPGVILREWLDGGPLRDPQSRIGCQQHNPNEDPLSQETKELQEIVMKNEIAKAHEHSQGNRGIYNSLLSYGNRRPDDHRIQFSEPQDREGRAAISSLSHYKKAPNLNNSCCTSDKEVLTVTKKRVTIHMPIPCESMSQKWVGKLILLPDSIEELFRTAGQKFGGCNPNRVVNVENAEIDDISVIRDGDHLFLLDNESQRNIVI